MITGSLFYIFAKVLNLFRSVTQLVNFFAGNIPYSTKKMNSLFNSYVTSLKCGECVYCVV